MTTPTTEEKMDITKELDHIRTNRGIGNAVAALYHVTNILEELDRRTQPPAPAQPTEPKSVRTKYGWYVARRNGNGSHEYLHPDNEWREWAHYWPSDPLAVATPAQPPNKQCTAYAAAMPKHLTEPEILKLLDLLEANAAWLGRIQSRLEQRGYGRGDKVYDAAGEAWSSVHHFQQVVRGLDESGRVHAPLGSRRAMVGPERHSG